MPQAIIPMPNKIQSEIIDIHSYLTVVAYIHYFLPGSLKIRTKLRTVKLGQIAALIDHPQLDQESIAYNTRRSLDRWFPKREMPYPGYCRAPGSSKCIPTLCNCKGLDEKWKIYLDKQKNKTQR